MAVFAGKAKPEDALTGRQGELRLNRRSSIGSFFTLICTLGLYYEAAGTKNWRANTLEAAEEYKVDDYMGD